MSTSRIIRLTITLVVTAVILVAFVGYPIAVFLKPLPPLQVQLTAPPETTFTAPDDEISSFVNSYGPPTAVSWAELDRVWSNTNEPHPLASITKVAAVLTALDTEPLSADTSTWPNYTWTYEDAVRQEEYLAMNGIIFPFSVGTELSLAHVFDLIFLPSANDFASAYVYSVFENNEAFVNASNQWAQKNGLDTLKIFEPTGLNGNNVASPEDVAKLARIALNDPVVSQFIHKQSAFVPYIGFIENTNKLIGEYPGVVGVKTGTLDVAGYNLVSAAVEDVDGKTVTGISVVLGRETPFVRNADSIGILETLNSFPAEHTVLESGSQVGTITTWQGETVNLFTTETVSGTFWPAQSATVSHEVNEVALAVPAGSEVGRSTINVPWQQEEMVFRIETDREIVEPTFFWKLTNPRVLWP